MTWSRIAFLWAGVGLVLCVNFRSGEPGLLTTRRPVFKARDDFELKDRLVGRTDFDP